MLKLLFASYPIGWQVRVLIVATFEIFVLGYYYLDEDSPDKVKT
jgi:hypothetical protein